MTGTQGNSGEPSGSSSNTAMPDNPLVNYLVNPPFNPPFDPPADPPTNRVPRRVVVPSSEPSEEGEDEVQPILDANERLELRRMVTTHQNVLTESSNFNLWHTNLLRTMAYYKLAQHIVQ